MAERPKERYTWKDSRLAPLRTRIVVWQTVLLAWIVDSQRLYGPRRGAGMSDANAQAFQLTDDDIAFLLMLLRNSSRPLTTAELVQRLREQGARSSNEEGAQ